jgi:hypothetical protein
VNTALANQVVQTPVLVLKPDTVVVKELSLLCTKKFNTIGMGRSNNIWFIKNKNEQECSDISEISDSFVNYGIVQKFSLNEWNKRNTAPPFVIFWKFFHENMTPQEAKVLYLWKKVRYVYDNMKFVEL